MALASPTILLDTTIGTTGSALIIHANEDDQVTDVGRYGSRARIALGVTHGG